MTKMSILRHLEVRRLFFYEYVLFFSTSLIYWITISIIDNNETTGIWQAVRDIASDEEKLRKLCRRAHRQYDLGPEDDVIDRISFGQKILTFHDPRMPKVRVPILIDVVTYGVTRLPKNLWFLHKGTRCGCVYYMMQWDAVGKKFRTGIQICGVHVPV